MFYVIIIFILSIFLLHSSEIIAIFIAKSEPIIKLLLLQHIYTPHYCLTAEYHEIYCNRIA